MAFDLPGVGSAASDLFGAAGDFAAAKGYDKAAGYSKDNARLSKIATGIEEIQATRQIYQVMGAQSAATAAAGFSFSGTAIDLMKSSASQGSLDKALIANQGLIEENTYLSQAAQYEAQAKAGKIKGIGGIVSAGLKIAAMASDARLKLDVETVSFDARGRRWVNFRYTWDPPGTVRHGVIAQEVMLTDPGAVFRDPQGMLMVDYSKLVSD